MRSIEKLVLLGTLISLGGCGSPGSHPATSPGSNTAPHVAVTTIFTGSSPTVYSVRPDWTARDSSVVFSGGPSGNIWKVAARAASTPVPVTNPDSSSWVYGGYTPACLADGRSVYYLGWLGSDENMHLMVAAANQVRCLPSPTILHSFNGSDVGLSPGSANTPDALSLSGSGDRALALWGRDLYLLDWRSNALVATRVTVPGGGPVFDPMLSRDGSRLAYADSAQRVTWIPAAGGAPTVVGQGLYPSFSGDGHLLGYLNTTGTAYVVFNLTAGTSILYALESNQIVQYPRLSWDGTRIVFRTFGGESTGISIGQLSS